MKVWQPHLLLLSPVRLSLSLRPSALSPDSLEPPSSGSVSAGRHPHDDLHGGLRVFVPLHPCRQDHLPSLSFPVPQHCHQVITDLTLSFLLTRWGTCSGGSPITQSVRFAFNLQTNQNTAIFIRSF